MLIPSRVVVVGRILMICVLERAASGTAVDGFRIYLLFIVLLFFSVLLFRGDSITPPQGILGDKGGLIRRQIYFLFFYLVRSRGYLSGIPLFLFFLISFVLVAHACLALALSTPLFRCISTSAAQVLFSVFSFLDPDAFRLTPSPLGYLLYIPVPASPGPLLDTFWM